MKTDNKLTEGVVEELVELSQGFRLLVSCLQRILFFAYFIDNENDI